MWIQQHKVRLVIYLVSAATILATVGATFRLCRRGSNLVAWLADRPAFHRLSEQVGVQYSIRSLDICCLSKGCFWGASAAGIDLRFTQQPIQVRLDNLQVSPIKGISLQGVAIGTTATPDLITVNHVQTDLQATDLQQMYVLLGVNSSDSYLRVEKVTAAGLTLSRDLSRALTFRQVALDGVKAVLQRGSDDAWHFERAHALGELLQSLASRPVLSLDALYRGAARLRRLLAWVLTGLATLLIVLKLLLTRGLPPKWPWMPIAALAVILPLLCYGVLFWRTSLLGFLLLSSLASFAAAAGLERALYRRAREWHQRWEPLALDVISPIVLLPLLVVRGVLPRQALQLPSIHVAEAVVRNTSAALRERRIGEGNLATLELPELAVNDVAVTLHSASAQLRSVSLGRATFRGTATGDLSALLHNVQWLPRSWTERQRITLCGSLRDSTLATVPLSPGCEPETVDLPRLSVSGVAGIDLAQLSARYSLVARLQAAPVDARFEVQGNQRSLEMTRIRTSPASRLLIEGGTTRLAFANGIEGTVALQGLRLQAGGARLSLPSLEARLFVPSAGDPTGVELTAHLKGAGMESGGSTFALGGATVRINLANRSSLRRVSLAALFRRAVLAGRRPGETGAWLNAELPCVRLRITGQASPELIPRTIEGQGRLLVARPGVAKPDPEAAFWTDRPLRFALNLWRGAIDVLDQPLTVHQSVVRQAPASVALRLSMKGRLFSLAPLNAQAKARVRIPRLAPDVLPLRAELNDLDLATVVTVDPGGVKADAKYSGLAAVAFPAFAQTFELKDLTELTLDTTGSMPVLPAASDLLDSFAPLAERARRLRGSLPPQVSLKLEGQCPLGPTTISFARDGRTVGIRIDELKIEPARLSLPDGRLEELEIRAKLRRIRTLDGDGDLGVDSEIGIQKGIAILTASMPLEPGQETLRFVLHRSPEDLEFRLTRKLSVASLVSAADPFLEHFGWGLAGITPGAEVERLQTKAQFSGAALTALDGALDLAPGLLLSADLAKLLPAGRRVFFTKLDASLESGTGLHLRVGSATGTSSALPIQIAAEVERMRIRATDHQGREYEVGLSANSKARAVLHFGDTPPSTPLARRLATAFTGLSRQASSAIQAFTGPASPDREFRNLTWTLNLSNRSSEQPVLSLDQESASLALRVVLPELAWHESSRVKVSRVSSTVNVETNIKIHRGELVADGFVPVDLVLKLPGKPENRLEFRLPYLVLLAERLRKAGNDPDLLWDSDYYDSIWRDYRPVHASDGRISMLNARELVVGPVSLQQIQIPAAPLRAAIGYADGLELDLSATSRLLGGRGDGRVQVNLRWIEPAGGDSSPGLPTGAVLDSRTNLKLGRLQTSAVGLASAEGHIPLIDDEINGEVKLRTDGFVLNRQILRELASGSVRSGELDRLGIKARLWSDVSDRKAPAALEAVANVQLRPLNDLLKKVARDLALQAPPRAVLYDSMTVNFEAENGQVSTRPAIFEMRGMKMFSTDYLELDGTLRLHLGVPGETFPLRNLFQLAGRALTVAGVVLSRPDSSLGNMKVSIRRNQ